MYSLISVLIAVLTGGIIAIPSPATGPHAVLPAEVASVITAEQSAQARERAWEAEREQARAKAEAERARR